MRAKGTDFEERAADYLTSRDGWRLIGRNYLCRMGEIDLIFEQTRERGGIELVFVEVRSRAAGSWVTAAESVDGRKRMRLERAARKFLAAYRGRAKSVRFDVLGWDGERWTQYENAW